VPLPIGSYPDGGASTPSTDPTRTLLGVVTPPPPPPTAIATLGGAPTVSSTPVAGQGISLDSAGNLPSTISQGLLQLAVPGKLRLAYGTGTWSFTASATSAESVVTHGLGATPVVVLICSTFEAAFGITFTYGATTFSTIGYATSAITDSTASFVWLALG
jgi:hypothetical protein